MNVILLDNVENLGSVGDLVKVKVMSVDLERKRIALSMRLGDRPEPGTTGDTSDQRAVRPDRRGRGPQPPAGGGALAAAFSRAKKGRGSS